MLITNNCPPQKPKRYYLPFSLSFDDAEERRKRYEKRKRKEMEKKESLPREFHVLSRNSLFGSAEIPYIDADPFSTSPHIDFLQSPVKFRAKPKRNHLGRPKSAVIIDSELFDSASNNTPSKSPALEGVMDSLTAPTILSYSEWKQIFEQRGIQQRTSNFFSTVFDRDSKERPSSSRYSVLDSSSPMRKLKAKMNRSKSSNPPESATRIQRTDFFADSDTMQIGKKIRKELIRCNSDSSDDSLTRKKQFVRSNAEKGAASKNRGSTHSNSSAEKRSKSAWLSSAGRLRSAFTRGKKNQIYFEYKFDRELYAQWEQKKKERAERQCSSLEYEVFSDDPKQTIGSVEAIPAVVFSTVDVDLPEGECFHQRSDSDAEIEANKSTDECKCDAKTSFEHRAEATEVGKQPSERAEVYREDEIHYEFFSRRGGKDGQSQSASGGKDAVNFASQRSASVNNLSEQYVSSVENTEDSSMRHSYQPKSVAELTKMFSDHRF